MITDMCCNCQSVKGLKIKIHLKMKFDKYTKNIERYIYNQIVRAFQYCFATIKFFFSKCHLESLKYM